MMKRTKMPEFKKADLILMSDLHIRDDQPIARTDNFQEAMWRKLTFISELQKKHGCPILNGGDLFNFWKPSPELLSKATKYLPDNMYSIYGQHDVPQHSLQLAHKSGMYNLIINEKIKLLKECSWEQTPTDGSFMVTSGDGTRTRKILVWHIFNYQGKEPWPGCTSPKSGGLLRKYPQFDLILTGDNHQPFVETYKDRLLVNPGSVMRSTAGQVDHKPRVYLYFASTNTVEAVYLPIEEGVINRDHIEVEEKRTSRINAFVSKLNGDYEVGLSFEDNLAIFENSNEVEDGVMEIIYKSIENEEV